MPPRAIGRAHVAVRLRDADAAGQSPSVLSDLHQSGSMRVLFPRPAAPPTAMLLNTAGGITGGDRFDISLEVGKGAHLTVTTQAAERAYAAMPGPAGRLSTAISVAEGGAVRWLPQETILFDNSDLNRRLDVELDGDNSSALIVEPLVFGRHAHGEILTDARLRDRIRINRNGRAIFADGIDLAGNVTEQLRHPARGGGAGAMATVVLAHPSAEAQLTPLRLLGDEILGSGAQIRVGTSLLAPDLLVLRCLADDSFNLRRVLLPVLDHLTNGALPICWRL
ncbi:urease accessory protein UreD [Aliishimia ponticola]|uniref:Urease accessory protein UreD n=2 Tax=Aliishimia ponticola TaxID=2499833 RepID=A0A4S4NAI4_9RHOB|nr:urease accessory protein UreD [Aliishimia ponticola]